MPAPLHKFIIYVLAALFGAQSRAKSVFGRSVHLTGPEMECPLRWRSDRSGHMIADGKGFQAENGLREPIWPNFI